MRRRVSNWIVGGLAAAVVLLGACAPPTPAGTGGAQAGESAPAPPHQTKALTIGITGSVPAVSIAGGASPVGGWVALTEMHTDGLITADAQVHQPIGRLAERVPSLDDGSITLLPDGQEQVTFHLRPGVTWQDGVPFTAQDLAFSYQVGGPGGLPTSLNPAARFMAAVEAPDDATFVITYKQPYFPGAFLGPQMFWPLPQHLLADAAARYAASHDPNDLLQDPYWTSAYVSTGPFRLTSFDPGAGMDFQAYDGYFLGRPRIDVVHVHIFNDDNTLESSLLAGTVDLTPELALRQATGVPLQNSWKASGAGTVYVTNNALTQLEAQMRPAVQMEAADLDPRVRAALYVAFDREELSDAVNGGNPQLAAWSILPESDPLYSVTKDSLRPFAYDPERAITMLHELGWTAGADGQLRNDVDGRPFHTSVWASLGDDVLVAALAAQWRRIGLAVDEHVTSAAESRDESVRTQFPGWDTMSDDFTDRLSQTGKSAETRWVGNRNGFDDPEARQLAAAFLTSLDPNAHAQAMQAINAYFVRNMVTLPLFFQATWMAARTGVQAYDDLAGGFGAHVGNSGYWGSYYRNAYRWDIQ